MSLLSVALEFVIAVLLAFAGFTMRVFGQRATEALDGVQKALVAISGIDSKLDGIDARLERLERMQDQEKQE